MSTEEAVAALAAFLLPVIGLIYHAGKMAERLAQLRREHDALHKYTHDMTHEMREYIHEEFARLSSHILKITPKDQWPGAPL